VRYLTSDEETALLGALPPKVRDIVLAAALSGMRRSELVGLKWPQVDLATRWITLMRTKSNRVRRVPMNDALVTILGAIDRPKNGEGWVFRLPVRAANAVGVTRDDESRRRDYVSRTFKDAVRAAKIQDLRFHDLRHDFATRVRRSGAGIDVIAMLLGHSTLAMATRYAHIEDPLLRAAVKSVPQIGAARENVVSLAARRTESEP
jgi:integrase